MAACLIGCASPSGEPPSQRASDAAASGADANVIGEVEPDAGGFFDSNPLPTGTGDRIDVALPTNVGFTDTGLTVARGELVNVLVSGEITFAAGQTTGPDGTPSLAYAPRNVVAPVRHAAVIGRIGAAGAPFRVGSAVAFYAPVEGPLYLGVNDLDLADNTGTFAARVDVGPTGTVPVVTPSTTSVSVSATVPWIDAGVDLATFAQVTFSTTGTVNVAPTVPIGPGGTPNPDARVYNILPGTNHGVVLAKIGTDGIPFALGASLALMAPYAGRLHLAVNDIDLANNSGAFTTSVAIAGP